MSENAPPIRPDLQRELEQVRAASTPSPASPQPPVQRTRSKKWIVFAAIGWFFLILAFLAIWQFLASN